MTGEALRMFAAATVFCSAALVACGDDPLFFPFLTDVGSDTAAADAAATDAGPSQDVPTDSPAVLDLGRTGDADPDDVAEEIDEPDLPPPDPCEGVVCGADELCFDGLCDCIGGFVRVDGECRLADADDPFTRTAEQVCDYWNADYAERATRVFTPGSDDCAPGQIDPTAHEDGMRRLNLFRWLVGLKPAGVDWGNQELAQYASVMFDRNNSISHFPPASWRCYTDQGARAASSSNLALGYPTPAASVDGYVGDDGVDSLGHRRWCLSPSLDDVGFGHYGRGGAMWAFGSASGRPAVEYVAYPPPGPVPLGSIMGEWSFSSPQNLSDVAVTVVDITRGQEVSVGPDVKESGFSFESVGWRVPGTRRDGDRFRITVRTAASEWTYETEFVSCF